MIIDCHGHYTTSPRQHEAWRTEQIAAHAEGKARRRRVPRSAMTRSATASSNGQLKLQQERGTDLTIFSPRAAGMGHHLGDAATSEAWASACNELIHRVCTLFPRNFVGVCMLPQSAGVSPRNCIAELERCVRAVRLRRLQPEPRPVGRLLEGSAAGGPLLVSVLREAGRARCAGDGPCQLGVQSGVPHHRLALPERRHAAFMQCLTSDLFKDFPTLKFIIPHGGGAVPYHWGRFRGWRRT